MLLHNRASIASSQNSVSIQRCIIQQMCHMMLLFHNLTVL